MSDGDVSLIQDEDLLRRMWQQTEDFSRKKEIRAHMYRLREERLRNLYSPEPRHEGKGNEFTAAQDHVKSFADQSFQSMKSKEVRDAGSPPKEFTYRGQDLKALSNAGWNVEQENKITDDGRTHVKSINANIEGRYDVDGGKGQFAAVDHHKEAVTEYQDDNSSLKRNETSSNTAAREHVVRQTDDGTHVSSTTNSSTSTSKVQQMSSTRHESVPYTPNDDYDLRRYDTNRNDTASSVTRKQIKTDDYEQNLRSNDYEQTLRQSDYETGELVSRKVDYPDDNTRVVVETRCLPDGTRVTSTKREFRAPVQSTRSEQVHQTRSENRSYSTQQRSNTKDSTKVIHHTIDNSDQRPTDIVDSQRNVDDYDFNRQVADYSTRDTDDYSNTQHYERKVNKKVIDHSKSDDDYSNIQRVTKINRTVVDDDNSNIKHNVTKINKTFVDHSKTEDNSNIQRHHTTINKKTTDSSKTDDYYSKIGHHDNNINQRVVDHSKPDDDYHTTHSVTKIHKTTVADDNNDNLHRHRETNQRQYNITTDDDYQKVVIKRDEHNVHEKDYKDVEPTGIQPRGSKPRETSIPKERYPRDSQPSDTQPKDIQPKNIQPKSTEKIVNITKNEKVEEVFEKKTNIEQRQTTYQTDFTQKKISTDWSPSHTAWASTLRSDTPSTTRPSTRTSSPGSRTFKSSTSSLRSSVSPDKTNRKPPSRGSSPNKVDRSSPTRPVTDHKYATHSSHSVKETKSHKYSTPDERRPPTGRQPQGDRYSPERKPQDHRQRPSVSPEKIPQDLVYRNSPDKKPTLKSPSDNRPRTDSPVNRVHHHSPTRPRASPERKPSPVPSATSVYPSSPNRSTVSPDKTPADHQPYHQTTRPSQSPDRKPTIQKSSNDRPQSKSPTRGYQPAHTTPKHDRPNSPTTEKYPKDTPPNRGSVSPNRKPGYMTPTASSQPADVRKSPTKHTSSSSPTRTPSPYKKYQEDHYKFIDEETKMYTRTDKTETDTIKRMPKDSRYSSPREDSPSPTRKSPVKDTDCIKEIPERRSPSPKQPLTEVEKYDLVDTTIKTITDNVTVAHSPKKNDSPKERTVPRQTSPSKPGAQDTSKPRTKSPVEHTRNTSLSPTRKSPGKDTESVKKVPGRRSPSPQERTITTEKHDRVDTTIKTSKVTDKVINTHQTSKDKDSPREKTEPRQPSPTRFGTYDKKKPYTDTPDEIEREKSPSPTRKSPIKDHDAPKKLSTPKHFVTKTEKYDSVTTTYSSPKETNSPRERSEPREMSPSKFGTYDKRKPYTENTEIIKTTKDVKYDTVTREKSPKESPEQPLSPTRRAPELPVSPTKKSPERFTSPSKKVPRDNVSPVKSPTKPSKYKHTTDFLASERTIEEVNKKTTKEHPRQLVTPSSSPTRKPKRPTDTEPSTGQSSPTTSVSGFVYFSSPRTEEVVVTDLDDQEIYTETHLLDKTVITSKRPESLDVKRSPSPSKIPRRSPSPERRTSPLKESLPRKSSLKKPVSDYTQTSPVEKPPTTFHVSPTEESKEPHHKVVKKDNADEPKTKTPLKSKPPLERRETYEDRCRKILGMTEDTAETVNKQTSYLQEPETNTSSSSISPCRSPTPKDTPYEYPTTKAVIESNVDVTDFIKHEQEDIVHKTSKTPNKTSRDSSPTKLQDIITVKRTVTESDVSTKDAEEVDIKETKTIEYPVKRSSPQRKTVEDAPSKITKHIHKHRATPEGPITQKEINTEFVKSSSPVKLHSGSSPRSSLSPERKPHYESKEKYPLKEPADKTPGYIETTTTVLSKYDTDEDTEHITVTTKRTDRKKSLSTDSPMRKITGDTISQPKMDQPKEPEHDKLSDTLTRPSILESTISMVAEYGSAEDIVESTKETIKTHQHSPLPSKPTTVQSQKIPGRRPSQEQSFSPEKIENKPKDSSPTRPSYTKSSVPSKYDSVANKIEETSISESIKHKNIYSGKVLKELDNIEPHKPSDKIYRRKPSDTQDKPLQRKASPEPDDKYPEKSSPGQKRVPGYLKTTKSTASKYDTDTNEDHLKVTTLETERHQPIQSSESSPRKTPREADDLDHPLDKTSKRKPSDTQEKPSESKISPEQKPTDKYPENSTLIHGSPKKVPGYLKTTKSTTSKHDSISAEDYEEITTSKTERHHPLQPSESPTRKTSKSEDYPHETGRPHNTDNDSNDSNFRPSHKPILIAKETSPDRYNSKKTPHYMTPISPHTHVHETETTTEDEYEQRISTEYETPQRSYSPSHLSTKETPHYMQSLPRHTHETISSYVTEESRAHELKTRKPHGEQTPHYMTPISPHVHKHETITTEDDIEMRTSPVVEDRHPSRDELPESGYSRTDEISTNQIHERKPSYQQPSQPHKNFTEKHPEERLPTKNNHTTDSPGYNKTSTTISKYDTRDDYENTTLTESTSNRHKSPTRKSPGSKHTPDSNETKSPSKPYPATPKDITKKHASSSPDRQPGYMKPTASVTSKQETENIETTDFKEKLVLPRSSVSPLRDRSPDKSSRNRPSYLKEPKESRQLRTPSPSKKTVHVTEVSTDFLMSEREQEVLDRVQKSLRKLSPERKEKSPSRERSPEKTTTSLQDIDINVTTQNEIISEKITEVFKKHAPKPDMIHTRKIKEEIPKDQKMSHQISKPSSRNTSPTKKPSGIASPTKLDKGSESTSKPRSTSPKKPMSSTERPQSPLSKTSGIKPKEQISSHLTRKPTPATLSTKIEKTTSELKKTSGVTTTKLNSFTKVTTSKMTTKSTPSPVGRPSEPRTPTPKGLRESGIPKKEIDTKVTRTVSDITIKSKKLSPTSPQRMKSKPEIQVSDMSTSKSKLQKSSLKEPQSRLPGKPKSATTLNTPSDEDDIIIDVQQSKSSRENSPDRICPTPVNFVDDDGTPRYPDEVKEPEDEFRRRTHHIIHETESIVDDIVEICEDDELFVRKSDIEHLTEEDESLLSVTDKVTKFTKGIDTTIKPKDTTSIFKDTERRVHSDFEEENLKSDECLLSVSEKVNKFAKGPRDTKDKSPARRVVDEYDKNTVYTDDYTKLSVHDKAHLFVETAENVKSPKTKPAPQRVERPDLTNVDEALKSDDCLLSVSDKVSKFVKTAEQFLTETQELDEKEKIIKEQHEKIMKKIVDDIDDDTYEIEETIKIEEGDLPVQKVSNHPDDKSSITKVTTSSSKVKDYSSPYLKKPTERPPTVKITTLRSSEAVKKAKALFENIASTTPKTKDTTHPKTSTKLTDIGVMKKSLKADPIEVVHPSGEEVSFYGSETDTEIDSVPIQAKERPTSSTLNRPHHPRPEDKPRASPTRLSVQSPDGRRSKSPMRHTVETTTTTKTMLSKHPTTQRAESPKNRLEGDKNVPGYLRPTKTSQSKEEPKEVDEKEVSSRRGSGKFGVELRRTSVERSTVSSERRRSVEHPCIEDIFDLNLLEQMLEKVVGYEQRRRIRAQIRIARKMESEHVDHTKHTRTTKQTSTIHKERSPQRHQTKSPDRAPKTKPHKTASPDRQTKTPTRTVPDQDQLLKHDQHIPNGHAKEPVQIVSEKQSRPQSPTKSVSKSALKTKSPNRPASPEKKTRNVSPTKTASQKPKGNRFNEYAFAYMKKVGLNEADKLKFTESKKKTIEEKHKTVKQVEEHKITEEISTSKTTIHRTPSEEIIEVIQMNGSKRSPSPEKRQSPERKSQSRERVHERTPSPDKKQPTHHTKSVPIKKETIIKTVYEIEKKVPQKQTPEIKPSWVTDRNLKKITSEARTYSSKKIEEKPRYRAASPSKVISKPIDVITSSYGPGPLDAEGKPLFGIKALRNGASNYQVKGTVIRQEYHSRNGGEPEGTVSVTAYSTEPEELEQLLQRQGEQPSRIHGLAAITTTRKFGGDTGTTLKEIHGKEERATIDQFTHSDRKVSDTRIEDITESYSTRQEIIGDTRRIETSQEEIVEDVIRDRTDSKTDKMQKRAERVEKVERRGDRVERKERPDDKKTVRQSSVKSLTEKYIKSANESSKAERPSYPKAGLILRTATMKDSVSSDSSAHAGLARTDSEHSLGSVEDTVVRTERCEGGVRTTTTTTRSHHGHVTHAHHHTDAETTHTERSFLDSNTKVSGVQDILTRMKNADIVIQEGDTSEDAEARALLNKFLGATVLMAGMQSYVTEKPSGKVVVKQETVRTSSNSGGKVTSSQTRSVQEFDIDQCWDERVLRKLLDECNDYEQRRRLRARIRTLMAEQEACASAVTEALAAAGEVPEDNNEAREEEEVTVTSSVRRNSSEKTVSSSTTTTKTSKVIDSVSRPAPKPVSPFAKFRQLEKQNSTNSPKM